MSQYVIALILTIVLWSSGFLLGIVFERFTSLRRARKALGRTWKLCKNCAGRGRIIVSGGLTSHSIECGRCGTSGFEP